MGRYRHLSIEEREEIMCMLRERRPLSEIARAIGRDKSTVSREAARNGWTVGAGGGRAYRASTAQARYERRRASCGRRPLLADPRRRALVQSKILLEQWSPEQVAGRIALEDPSLAVSRATIYRAIAARELDTPELRRTARGMAGRLRRKGRRGKGAGERRGKIAVSHSIEERPAEAAARSRRGDWESDTVAGRQGGPCLVTNVDRMTGMLVGGRAERKGAAEVAAVMARSLAGHRLETVTPDRGSEFARHAEVTELLGVEFYFALPRHPWQRGTNENTNGLLREYFPKGCDLSRVTEPEVQAVYDKLNRRPRKRLGYRTPFEVYYDTSLHLI